MVAHGPIVTTDAAVQGAGRRRGHGSRRQTRGAREDEHDEDGRMPRRLARRRHGERRDAMLAAREHAGSNLRNQPAKFALLKGLIKRLPYVLEPAFRIW